MAARLHGTTAAAPYETLLLHRDGNAIPILITGGPRIEQGSNIGGAGTLSDLSALRRLQAERASAQSASDRTKDEFICVVSPELRTPLTSVKGFLDIVLDRP